jgi:Cu(I)/Ag(I) efflux system membrane fusion protein/cobalt-zinc-cadmium efflux system membrane fusion protein
MNKPPTINDSLPCKVQLAGSSPEYGVSSIIINTRGTSMEHYNRSRGKGQYLMSALVGIVLILTLGIFVGCSKSDTDEAKSSSEATEGTAQLWTCGMHPDVIAEEEGSCPICGMNLVPVKQDAATDGAEHAEVWTCSMDPDVLQDGPGECPKCGMDLVRAKTGKMNQEHGAEIWTCSMHPDVLVEDAGKCPKCGMNLVPVDADPAGKEEMENMDIGETSPDVGSGEGGEIAYWRAPMDPTYVREKPGKSPMGMDLIPVYKGDPSLRNGPSVVIDPVTVQNIGIQSTHAETKYLARSIRSVGHVDYNEESIYRVNMKYTGWVEKMFVDETGQKVKKGQKLIEIYAPELVSTQREYLLALQNADRSSVSSFSERSGSGVSLLEATRKRLEYWDFSAAQLKELEESGEVKKTVAVYAPADGIVLVKYAEQGMRLTPGMDLYRIADISSIWVYAHYYDEEMKWVRVGQEVAINLPYMPGTTLKGKIDFIYPFLDEQARDNKVRIVLRNPGYELKPGMYANILLKSTLGTPVVTIPDAAILRSGTRNLVFIDKGNGTYEPRTVILGLEGGDGGVQVIHGVEEGEAIVTSAQFLLDSESRLKEAIQRMLRERSRRSTASLQDVD